MNEDFRQEAEKVWDKLMAFSSYGFNRCFSGDTLIYRFTGNQYYPKEMSVSRFFIMKQNKNVADKYKYQGHMGKVRSYNPQSGKIEYNFVKDVHYNGKKLVYKVSLENGMFIKITANHRLMLSDGSFKFCITLRVGDELMTCGEKWINPETSYAPNGLGYGWIKTAGELLKRKKEYGNYAQGEIRQPYLYNEDGFAKNRKKVIERADGFCEHCNDPAWGAMEVHHVNGDNKNHSLDNLMYVHNSCHKKLDYELGLKNYKRDGGYHAVPSKIVSIEKLGLEDTYDLEMVDEPRNFVANGIVSHNSHASAYSIMGYWGQWIKAHYPLVFWTTALQYAKNEEETILFLSEKERHFPDIKIYPPDINRAKKYFVMDKKTNTIYWSLLKIKNLADKSTSVIIKERDENGKFKSIEDFFERMKGKRSGKRIMESLVIAGAFDSVYGITQKNLTKRRELLLKINELTKSQAAKEFNTTFAKTSNYFWQIEQQAISVLGFIDFYAMIRKVAPKLAPKYKTFAELEQITKSGSFLVAGIIDAIYQDSTKKGKTYAKVIIKSNLDYIRFFVWEESLEDFGEQLQQIKKEKALAAFMIKCDIKEGSNKDMFISFNDKIILINKNDEDNG